MTPAPSPLQALQQQYEERFTFTFVIIVHKRNFLLFFMLNINGDGWDQTWGFLNTTLGCLAH